MYGVGEARDHAGDGTEGIELTGEAKFTEREWHRKSAVDLFNLTWELLEMETRTREHDDRMVHAAHASRYHWGEVGSPRNLAIGEWQVSRVYAVLRRPEPALVHATRSLEICQKHGIGDFVLAYAYEALARSDAVAGRKRDLRRHLSQARAAGRTIRKRGDRDHFFEDLATIPDPAKP